MHIKQEKMLKSSDHRHERNTTRRPKVTGVQTCVTKLKGLYTYVTLVMSEWCSALTFINVDALTMDGILALKSY